MNDQPFSNIIDQFARTSGTSRPRVHDPLPDLAGEYAIVFAPPDVPERDYSWDDHLASFAYVGRLPYE